VCLSPVHGSLLKVITTAATVSRAYGMHMFVLCCRCAFPCDPVRCLHVHVCGIIMAMATLRHGTCCLRQLLWHCLESGSLSVVSAVSGTTFCSRCPCWRRSSSHGHTCWARGGCVRRAAMTAAGMLLPLFAALRWLCDFVIGLYTYGRTQLACTTLSLRALSVSKLPAS
jgi:hypothetical protein